MGPHHRRAWIPGDLDGVMQNYFTRLDFDGTGTCNSNDRLKRLCTNLIVKLDLDIYGCTDH